MKIKFYTTLQVNVPEIIKDCDVLISEEELFSDIKSIVELWAEQRLLEDGWPVPNVSQTIREYLIDNGSISERKYF
ncbi:hypothetical protein [Paenibacillus cremeus]|uniref:Uncharacterized protein n=1 Tax=Paenibacillus cremeus TaxID=2163881 RepID=A0A559KD56_9BACL|nr:hypothetical protein [Paenibacillus cremeus]TVY10054.1 hypothetical protein FPZ49_10035 [Paenibacillus cremeus]